MNMRLGLPIVAGTILLGAGIGWGQGVATNAAPKIVCDQPAYDFGTVDNRTELAHTFVIKNGGSGPLMITNIHLCCGATIQMGEKTIEAGKETAMEVKVSLKGRQGRVNKSLYLHSNDRNNPIFQLKIVGVCVSSNAVAGSGDGKKEER
jgi:hypothetical protein